jgi:phage terminase small subunit|tara:strand:- start:344 stop:880 length:537 start_codon:yes stop_codon:yes gene_type:complete
MANKSKLTPRQREFAKHYVEGIYSAKQCAIKSGYAEDSAKFHASKLLNGKDFPLVTEHIKELRDERERKYGVTLIGQLKRLSELSHRAEEEGQFSASINAEKTRSALGGLTVDRREQNHIHQLDKLSREEIIARLQQIRSDYPHAFVEGQFKKVDDDGEKSLVAIEEKSSSKNSLSKS